MRQQGKQAPWLKAKRLSVQSLPVAIGILGVLAAICVIWRWIAGSVPYWVIVVIILQAAVVLGDLANIVYNTMKLKKNSHDESSQ